MRIFVPSRMFSAKDEASHTKLKFRFAPPPRPLSRIPLPSINNYTRGADHGRRGRQPG